MSKRFLIAGVSAIAAALLLWIWISDRHDTAEVSKAGAPTETGSKATPSAPAFVAATPIKPPPPSSPPMESSATEALSAISNPETPLEADNPIKKYLTIHDRDARSLLQAFRTSTDKDYLNEALDRYPDDPMVLLHCVLYDTEPTEKRKAILQRLQELIPDDAVPYYLLGEQMLQEGDTEAALALLMDGSLKPYANNYANEIITDAQEFLVASGIPPIEALAQASFNLELRLLSPMRHLLSMVQDIHTYMSAKGDEGKSAKPWAIAGSRLAQSMHSQMSQTLIENLVSVGIEKKFLLLLPPETELVADGMTVAQRTKEIEEFHALVHSFRLMSDAALTLPEKEQLLFFAILQDEDELSALLWLNRRDQKKDDNIPNN